MVERLLIRILVGVALCVSVVVFIYVPVPLDGHGFPALPAVAVGQVGLYRLEVALLVFYGGLLLITPAFSGLVRGRLPIEVSARGAKFAVEVDRAPLAGPEQAEIKELRQLTRRLVDELAAVKRDMKQLKKSSHSDNTKPTVRSKND